jgi:hypothetical protein
MSAALRTRDGHERPRPGVPPGATLSAWRMRRCQRATRQYAEGLSAY